MYRKVNSYWHFKCQYSKCGKIFRVPDTRRGRQQKYCSKVCCCRDLANNRKGKVYYENQRNEKDTRGI